MRRILIAGSVPYADEFHSQLRREGYRISIAKRPDQMLSCLQAHTHTAIVLMEHCVDTTLIYLDRVRERFQDSPHTPPVMALHDARRPPAAPPPDDIPLFWYPDDIDPVLLLAQLRALLRRAEGYARHHRFGPLGLDAHNGRASLNGQRITLRPQALKLLMLLMEAQGRPAGSAALAARLWPDQPYRRERLAVQIHHLRRHLGGRQAEVQILSIKSEGYALTLRQRPQKTGDRRSTAN